MKRKNPMAPKEEPCKDSIVGMGHIYETTELGNPVLVCNLCGWKVVEVTGPGEDRNFVHTVPTIPKMDGS